MRATLAFNGLTDFMPMGSFYTPSSVGHIVTYVLVSTVTFTIDNVERDLCFTFYF